jgi:cysteine desulfurase
VVADDSERTATIGAYAMPGVSSSSQLVQFDLAGIAVSAGSACSSGSMKTSRVLEAMGVAGEIAGSVIRVSFGPETSADDVDRFLAEWRGIAERAGAGAGTRAA